MLMPGKQVRFPTKAVGTKSCSGHNLLWLLWHQYVLISQSTSRTIAQTSLRIARTHFKNMSSPCLLNCAAQRETGQSKAILTCTSFSPLAQKGKQTIWVYTRNICRTGKCCCHHFTDELVTEGQVTSLKSLYKSVQRQKKKTGLLPYATMFKLLDLLAGRIQTDSEIRFFWLFVTKLQNHLTVPPNLLWQKCGPNSIINESLLINKPTCPRQSKACPWQHKLLLRSSSGIVRTRDQFLNIAPCTYLKLQVTIIIPPAHFRSAQF